MNLELNYYVLILLYFGIFLLQPSCSLTPGGLHVCSEQRSSSQRYTTSCGFLNWRRCTRYRTTYYTFYKCCGGWLSKDGNICAFAICASKTNPAACMRSYTNREIIKVDGTSTTSSGGDCYDPEKCRNCNQGFYPSGPYCYVCLQINNCNMEVCTTSTNNQCSRCEGVVVEQSGKRAYVVSSTKKACVQACSWRADSTFCYPGTCANEFASSCANGNGCSNGHSGQHCLTINGLPSVTDNLVVLHDSSGTTVETPSNINNSPPQPTKFTNNKNVNRVSFKVTSTYKVPGTPPALPPYIARFNTGMIKGEAWIKLKRGLLQVDIVSPSTLPCSDVANADNPNSGTYVCSRDLSINFPTSGLVSGPLRSNDRITFKMTVTNGGYVDVKNLEAAGNPLSRKYYNGKRVTLDYDFTFDFDKPFHCTSGQSCIDGMLTAPDITTNPTFSLQWNYWEDALAGVEKYDIEVFPLVAQGNVLTEGPLKYSQSVTGTSQQIILDAAGAYSIILSVFDKAGNYELARRLMIFDSASIVSTMSSTHLRVTSSAASDYLWQQSLSSVVISWSGRYVNTVHNNNKWLNAVSTAYPDLKSSYDDTTAVRNTAAIDNVLGIVQFKTAWQKDHAGGSTFPSSPSNFQILNDLHAQTQTISAGIQDGDSFKFWIQAHDIVGSYKEEGVLIHVDSSPPLIENLWLTREDRLDLAVHSMQELNEMTIEWTTYDYHSGLHMVYWRLYDRAGSTEVLHGHENMDNQGGTQTLAECQQVHASTGRGPDCYCTPMSGCYHKNFQLKPRIVANSGLFPDKSSGTHDYDYVFKIQVTNKALLVTEKTIKITIDTSPPHGGIVHDGIKDSPEVDYQTSTILNAHWEGFFDRESSVKFYQYAFAEHCLSAAAFSLDATSSVFTETQSTHATLSVAPFLKNFITVVAYNAAMEPSAPVCSDGVTIDFSPPQASEIYIANVRTVGGLLRDEGSNVWLVTQNRYKVSIPNPTPACISKAPMETRLLSTFPVERFPNGTIRHELPASVCSENAGYSTSVAAVMTQDSYLFVNWTASDPESGLHDFRVGLASTSSADLAPDISPFTSTNQHTYYESYHPGLSEGKTFYIHLVATNKAGMSKIESIGPIIVELTKPDFTGSLTTTYDGSHLVTTWLSGAFSDAESSSLSYEAAVGTTLGGAELVSYSALHAGGSCSLSSPPSCTATSTDLLSWKLHGYHSYYVSVKVTNMAGLFVVTTSAAYVHDVELPSEGIVLDVAPDSESVQTFGIPDDQDFQASTSSLSARWSGFGHPHLSIAYEVGIGSSPGLFDILPRAPTTSDYQHTETGLSLSPMTTYYFTIVAVTSTGSVSVSSDGIRVLDVKSATALQDITVKDGHDCINFTFAHDAAIFTHHQDDTRLPCVDDVMFQASTSHVAAHWSIPGHLVPYVPEVYWAVELKSDIADVWLPFKDFEAMGSTTSVQADGLSRSPGRTYRSTIKFCAVKLCYPPIHSSGVTVTPHPPITGSMGVEYTLSGGAATITVTFEKFRDADISNQDDSYAVMDWHEWTLTDASTHGRILHSWKKINNLIIVDSTTVKFTVNLPKKLSFQECSRVSVRGYTKAGISAVKSADVKDCAAFNPALVVPRIILDAVGPPTTDNAGVSVPNEGQGVTLEQNSNWPMQDADYTPYSNILSAVWPMLRHRNYSWGAALMTNQDALTHYIPSLELNPSVPCDLPNLIECGTTDKEYVNIPVPGQLLHGKRYYVCVHADPTTVTNEKWTEDLPEVSVCTDGVTIDLTPPTPGVVWIGPDQSTNYQSSLSEVFVSWTSFVDIEEHRLAPHHSGIKFYEFAIGSTPGGVDIQNYVNVGVTNHGMAHSLRLQNGHAYYSSIRATDFVNKTSVAISKPIIIDMTPPEKMNNAIDVGGRHIMSSNVKACWKGVFLDAESGLSHFLWGVGSSPGRDDVMPFSRTEQECIETGDSGTSLVEGHAYYISVKGYNHVGLSSLATSWALVVDYSPPTIGQVYDGLRSSSGSNDIDYQTDIATLTVHWDGFYEPHSTLIGYRISIGTCAECNDAMSDQYVGLVTEFSVGHLQLSIGLIYYVTVSACNSADMCTSVSSDGVILDNTPPVPGHVMDGVDEADCQFQASRTTIGAKWYGFSDPQSGIQRYEWRAGTTVGGDDVLTATTLHVTDMAVVPNLQAGKELPVGVLIYVSVRAYNGAGQSVESVSNGFTVDTSAPTVVSAPEASSNVGSLVVGTHVYRNALRIQWEYNDPESFIARQYLSISSHVGGEFDKSAIEISPLTHDYTFTAMDFHDGGVYQITVTACNLAKLCSSQTTSDIIIDSSSPIPGMFAIQTNHAAALTRHEAGWMDWSATAVTLAWLGFADLHTGVDHYKVTVGSSYMSSDLLPANQPVTVAHSTSGADNQDEGRLQTATIATNALTIGESIYIAMWAINNVGLESIIIHSQFSLVEGGSLDLLRRCMAHSCDGQCVCAPQHQRCPAVGSCSDVSQNNPNTKITVFDVLNLRFTANPADVDYTASNSTLAAQWSIGQQTGKPIVRYEWSAGHTSDAMPTGIFGVTERSWFDAGENTYAVLALPRGKKLEQGLQYSFFVRAWYDTSTFAIFKSDGVTVMSLPPKSTTVQGTTIKETVNAQSTTDIDFTRSSTDLYIKWNSKFAGDVEKYDVSVGTYRGGDNVYHHSQMVTSTSLEIGGLSLEPFVTYHANVMAYTFSDLHALESSDGINVDNSKPAVGIVFDGLGHHDAEYQNASDVVAAVWHGFHDIESGIVGYFWCVGLTQQPEECVVKTFENVGLHTSASKKISDSVQTGIRIYNKVYAINAVGLQSETVVSDGIVVDATPPVPEAFVQFGANLIANPSFEVDFADAVVDLTDSTAIQGKCAANVSPASWSILNNTCSLAVKPRTNVAQDGETMLLLFGTIEQTVSSLQIGSRYRIQFYASHHAASHYPTLSHEAVLQIGAEKHVLLLFPRASRSDQRSDDWIPWQKHIYYYTAKENSVSLKLGTASNRGGILLDNVSMESYGKASSSTDLVAVHSARIQDWSSIHASWSFVDAESLIVNYQWAIGTVEGGTQLQGYRDVGMLTHASNASLSLSHNTKVYVTVLATNAAGLHSVTSSQPVLIDITPPVLSHVNDGLGIDVDTQDSNLISANWQVEDPESGIDHCDWAVGLNSGGSGIQTFQSLVQGSLTASAEFDLPQIVSTTVYVTIRCWNKAGLFTSKSSDGVAVVGTSPSADAAGVDILPSSATPYHALPDHHSALDAVRLHWAGFKDPAGIKAHQVMIQGAGFDLNKIVGIDGSSFSYADLSALSLTDANVYDVQVQSINSLDIRSPAVGLNVTVLTAPPQVDSTTTLDIRWAVNKTKFVASWEGVFHPAGDLFFEVSVGTRLGAADILLWQETRTAEIVFQAPSSLAQLRDDSVVIAVTAINKSGLFKATTFEINIAQFYSSSS